MTILDGCISLNSVQKFLVVLGVLDMCHLLLNSNRLIFLLFSLYLLYNHFNDLITKLYKVHLVPMVLLKPNFYFFVCFVLDTNTDQIKLL